MQCSNGTVSFGRKVEQKVEKKDKLVMQSDLKTFVPWSKLQVSEELIKEDLETKMASHLLSDVVLVEDSKFGIKFAPFHKESNDSFPEEIIVKINPIDSMLLVMLRLSKQARVSLDNFSVFHNGEQMNGGELLNYMPLFEKEGNTEMTMVQNVGTEIEAYLQKYEKDEDSKETEQSTAQLTTLLDATKSESKNDEVLKKVEELQRFSKMKVDDLKDECRSRGLKVSGNKHTLIDRLINPSEPKRRKTAESSTAASSSSSATPRSSASKA